MSDFVNQLVKKWKGECLHLSDVGLCGNCAASAIREALEEAEKVSLGVYECCECVDSNHGRCAAAIATLRGGGTE